ncbi:glycine cleavage system protein H [Anaeromyxobacter dehalogenans]|uniref:Glycine cleavage H-protein n=1 Tax=Anaeromyxobacter dehalogenans (strain 2CP-C) TaxID=290397 RepID=Q2IK94_ANADE|nr:Glycine cleavage H-protein [Anaeromyxobacter dehalogenans 2CP-C]
MAYDLLSVYPAKLLEYGLGIGYLLLFIPFWRYVQGGRREAREVMRVAVPVREAVSAALRAARPAGATAIARPASAGWFHVPADVHLHPGHTWARLGGDGLVSVGIDDFAHKLVGPATVELPAVGARVAQGEPAIELRDEDRGVAMLSPVDGTVVAVNPRVRAHGALEDPYGAGWLFKVKAPRLVANFRQLQAEAPAQRMLDVAGDTLALRLAPELGQVLQDGGTPVHGIARALAGERWDELAREYFLT